MSSIIGNIRDFFSDMNSRASTIEYSKLNNLTIGGVPLFTYGLIGITTVVLASYTILDYGDDDSDEEDENEKSMLNSLPTVEGIKETLNNISPFSSSGETPSEMPKEEENEEEKEESITGGKKKSNKKNKTISHRKKNRKSKTHKSKK